MNLEKVLTREEWEQVAESMGLAADKLKELAYLASEFWIKPEEPGDETQDINQKEIEDTIRKWRELEETMRLAVGAVLWVSENAADRVRFVMLDSHPPDGV